MAFIASPSFSSTYQGQPVRSQNWAAAMIHRKETIPRRSLLIQCNLVTDFRTLSILFSSATASLVFENNTNLGKSLSAPTTLFFLAILASNINLLPTSSAIYDAIWKYAIPISVASLLLRMDSAQLVHLDKKERKIYRDSFVAFGLGAIGTVLGCLISASLVRVGVNGVDLTWKIAAIFCATYIGGTVNYLTVARVVDLDPTMVSAGIAADMCLMAIYFGSLFAVAKSKTLNAVFAKRAKITDSDASQNTATAVPESKALDTCDLPAFAVSLAICSLICAASSFFPYQSGGIMVVSIIATMLNVCMNQIRQSGSKSFHAIRGFLPRLSPAFSVVSDLFMLLFFGTLGAASNLQLLVQASLPVVMFAFITLVVHCVFAFGTCWLLRIPLPISIIESNANVGGASTSSSFAIALKWNQLVGPALLTSSVGYGVSTFIALGVGTLLKR